jgi:hypothetical protein
MFATSLHGEEASRRQILPYVVMNDPNWSATLSLENRTTRTSNAFLIPYDASGNPLQTDAAGKPLGVRVDVAPGESFYPPAILFKGVPGADKIRSVVLQSRYSYGLQAWRWHPGGWAYPWCGVLQFR